MVEKYEVLCELYTGVSLVELPNGILAIKKEIDNPEIYETLQTIVHPGLPVEYGVVQEGGIYYALEEYINGQSLESVIASKGALDKKTAKNICMQICQGLEPLHKLKIIHRDLKPSNIILSSDGVVKIVDFGISRKNKRSGESDTQLLGTVGFASPEHFGFAQTSNKSDIFSIGMLIAAMFGKKTRTPNLSDVKMPVYYRIIADRCISITKIWRFKNVRGLYRALKYQWLYVIGIFYGLLMVVYTLCKVFINLLS